MASQARRLLTTGPYCSTLMSSCRRQRIPIQLRNSSSTSSPSAKPSTARRPLAGITVVSLEQAIAAPFCTRQLADHGARVIKVERPGVGDFARAYDTRAQGLSSHFVWTNRSKESLALDVKDPADMDVLRQLLGKADVLVQNLAPGAAARLGLSFEDLAPAHPRLIVCDISGYGQEGPYFRKKAYDLLVQSEAGVLSVTGTPEAPAKVGMSIADIAAGMYAYSNILAALFERSKSGIGCRIDVSMLESLAEWQSFPLYYSMNDAPGPVPAGSSHATIFPYGPFQVGKGSGVEETVMLGIQNEREWAKFCTQVLDDAQLETDPRFKTNEVRSQNRSELKLLIEEAFSRMTADEAMTKLEQVGIANAKVNDMKGVWNHPQLAARKRWTEIDTPVGRLPALLPPGFLGGGSAAQQGQLEPRMDAVPSVGEHNSKIFEELGIVR